MFGLFLQRPVYESLSRMLKYVKALKNKILITYMPCKGGAFTCIQKRQCKRCEVIRTKNESGLPGEIRFPASLLM